MVVDFCSGDGGGQEAWSKNMIKRRLSFLGFFWAMSDYLVW